MNENTEKKSKEKHLWKDARKEINCDEQERELRSRT